MSAYESQPQEIGLFPLNLVLVPGEQAPLHIFEPRYRELIAECLDFGADFGLLLEDDEGMREVGVRCAVVEVTDRFPDGRLNVVVEARERFQLLELTEGRSFRTAEVEEVPDETDTPTEDEMEECLAAYARVIAAADVEVDEIDLDADSIAYQIASRIDFGTEIKQGLLEIRSERERVIRLAPMLSQAAEAVERESEIRRRASGNGRVEPL
jgi:Lon protease-like protein